MNSVWNINLRILSTTIGCLILTLLAVQSVFAQPSKIVQGGVIAGVPYASTDFEDINLTNGALNLHFPLATLQGRGGVTHGFGLRYSSKLWTTITNPVYNPFYEPDPTYQTFMAFSYDAGWQDNSAYYPILWDRTSTLDVDGMNLCDIYMQYVYRWRLEMVAPGGRKIEFRPAGYNDSHVLLGNAPRGYFNVKPDGTVYGGGNCNITTTPPNGNRMTYYSTDGSGIRLTYANAENLGYVWEMSMPDGSRVVQTSTKQRILDKNGNFIESATITLPDSSQAPGWIDDVGRWIAKKPISSTEDHYFQKGFDGELLIWKVFWKTIYVRKPYVTTCASGCPPSERGPVTNQEVVDELRVVDRIELPIELAESEYATYSFEYHAKDQADSNNSTGWGEIKSITTPTEAKISYGYPLAALEPEEEYDELFPGELHMRTDQILRMSGKLSRKVLEYEETYDGQTTPVELEWQYAVNQISSSVISPDGGVSSQYYYHTEDDENKGGLVYKEIKPDGTIIEKNWDNILPVGVVYGSGLRTNPIVKFEVVTIPDSTGTPALSMIKDYNYDQNGHVISTAEYDWIPASSSSIQRTSGKITGFTGLTPARSTTTSYYNATPVYTSTSSSSNAYYFSTAPLFRNLPGVSDVRNSSDVPVSRIETYFDGSTSLSSSPTAGNPTLVRTWDSTKGSISSPLTDGNSIKTQATYNAYGMPLTTTDANGNVTTITYGNVTCPIGTATGLYPTQTVVADGTAIERTSSAVYDCYTGVVLSATDEDNDVTVVTEYDYLGRPVKVRNAHETTLESWITSEYDDKLRRVVVRSDLNTKGDGQKVAIQHFDQLGRVRLARTLEVPGAESPYNEEHGIKVQTRYLTTYSSPNGYTYQLTSNPYRAATSDVATNEETMGWTRSKAWHTGRKSEVETFSGAALPAPWGSNTSSTGVISTNIDADRTLVTDQAGKQRISKTNALGQLKEVWEILAASETGSESVTFPGTAIAHGFKTIYNYDTLNNLTTVSQGVQTRTFTYSSLSRLLSATNPESGTISYIYDNNENLTKKTDARSIETEYSYDALNRVTNREFSDSTPAVEYFYGTTAPKTGKLIKVESGVSTTEYTSFDILGRVTEHKQTTDGEEYETNYAYNLSGTLVEQIYPSGRKVKYILDNDGDLSIVQSRKSENHGYWNYASSFSYSAARAVTGMQLGNGRWESIQFNSRLQPTQIALGTVQNGTDKLKLEYDYGTSQNNGNVLSQTITVPTVGVNLGFTAIQSYTYDSLNRLKSGEETISSVQTWKQTFTFDRYGNRNFDEDETSTLPKTCGTSPNFTVCAADKKVFNPAINQLNNRLSTDDNYVFDSSGNTTEDPLDRTFIYDAENRQVEVKDQYNNTIGKYFYDGDGKRVKKYVPDTGEVTIFVYGAVGKLVAEYSTQISQDPKVSYTTSDHLGSPRILTDENGDTISRRDFHPFGEEIYIAERIAALGYHSDDVRQKFTGYERDDETNLDFAQARYYAGLQGRFASPDLVFADQDIAIPQSWNMFSYVRNNPLAYIDPQGRELRWAGDIDRARQFTCEILGTSDCNERVKYNEKTGVVTIDISEIDLSKNEGAKLLHQLDKSDNVYQLTVSEEIDTRAGTRPLEGLVDNLDGNPDNRYTKGKPDSQMPPSGIDNNVGVLPKVISISGPDKLAPPLWLIVFHELAEAYAKVDGSKQYLGAKGAHQEALDRETNLRTQRPSLSVYSSGGAPDAIFLKLGPKNSVRYVSGVWNYKNTPKPKSK